MLSIRNRTSRHQFEKKKLSALHLFCNNAPYYNSVAIDGSSAPMWRFWTFGDVYKLWSKALFYEKKPYFRQIFFEYLVIFIFNVQKLMAVWDEYFRWRLKLALTTHLTGVLQQNCLTTLLSNNNRSTAAAVSVKSPLYSRNVVCNLCDVYQIEQKIFFSHFCVI